MPPIISAPMTTIITIMPSSGQPNPFIIVVPPDGTGRTTFSYPMDSSLIRSTRSGRLGVIGSVRADAFDDAALGAFDDIDDEAFRFEVVERLPGDVIGGAFEESFEATLPSLNPRFEATYVLEQEQRATRTEHGTPGHISGSFQIVP
jgi:hypothetical protein